MTYVWPRRHPTGIKKTRFWSSEETGLKSCVKVEVDVIVRTVSVKANQSGASLSIKVRPPSIIMISTSSLTSAGLPQEVTHAIILTDPMSLLQKVKRAMGSPDCNVSIVDTHLRKLLWMYCPEDTGVKGNDRAGGLASKVHWTCKDGGMCGLTITS